jgi:hypothetical protein
VTTKMPMVSAVMELASPLRSGSSLMIPSTATPRGSLELS